MCNITAIERYCAVPVSSIRLLTLYLPGEVLTVPVPGLGVFSATEPAPAVGALPISIPFDRFSCSLGSVPDTTGQPGDFWTHRIQLGLRRNRAALGLWMLRMRNRKFHLVAEDWHGERMWFPGMRLASTRTVEERLSGRNGFGFAFSRRWQHPGVYLKPNPEAPSAVLSGWSDSDGPWSDSDGGWVDTN